jgi:hypothetical protein
METTNKIAYRTAYNQPEAGTIAQNMLLFLAIIESPFGVSSEFGIKCPKLNP